MGGPRHPRIIRGGEGETWTGNLRDYHRVQMPSRYNTFHVNCLEPRVHIRAGFCARFLNVLLRVLHTVIEITGKRVTFVHKRCEFKLASITASQSIGA